jgi:hypothetical protein
MKQVIEVGDIVVCWRPSIFLSERYLAEVLRVIPDKFNGGLDGYEVKHLRKFLPRKHLIESHHMQGLYAKKGEL